MQREIKTVCFAASSGGHFEQLMMLRPLMEKYDSFIVTEKTSYVIEVGTKTYLLNQVNRRERALIPKMLANMVMSISIFVREHPDAIICTGVLSTIPLCLIGKIAGSKLIYIESFAKVTSPTKTGKLMYHFADRFYVQWESMLESYPKAVYVGGIY